MSDATTVEKFIDALEPIKHDREENTLLLSIPLDVWEKYMSGTTNGGTRMKTQFSVSLSFDFDIDLEEFQDGITEQNIRDALGKTDKRPLLDWDFEYFIKNFLEPTEIYESGSIQRAKIVEVIG